MADRPQRGIRVAGELLVRLTSGAGVPLARSTLDVSRGGVFVRSLVSQPVGAHLTLELALAGGPGTIRATGLVVWTTPPSAPGEPPRAPGMGIRFLDLDQASQDLLDAWLTEHGGAGPVDAPPRPSGEVILGEEGPPAPGARRAGPVPVGRVVPTSLGAVPLQAPALIRPRSSRVVGIDLGTTNSCVAVARNGRAQVLASRLGQRTLPSVVAFDEQGRLLVGHPAKAQRLLNPQHSVYGFKRLVGRPFASPAVQACRDRFHYQVVPGPEGAAAVRFAGREFSLQQIAALVLAELREVASEALGETVERAVVTVPAHYNDLQREAVRQAAGLAGLAVDRIVSEPTAAALAFGYGKGLDEQVLVYDLGGGTFDASVLRIRGELYEVVSTGGETFLGGADFDAQLVDHLAWAFAERHGTALPPDRPVWQRLHAAAEELKIALSDRERVVARLPGLGRSGTGEALDLEVAVTRAELEALTGQLIDRSLAICREVLEARQLGPDDVQEVLLVGGQSRMPLVWTRTREFFGRDPSRGVHPDEAVAIGAALLADSAGRVDAEVLLDAVSSSIGVGLPDGRMVAVLPRQLRLPAHRTFELTTTHDGQAELELRVYQGDSPRLTGCARLGALRVTGLPPAAKGTVRVVVEFALGPEGILSITARNPLDGAVTTAEVPTRDAPEALRARLGAGEPARPEAPEAAEVATGRTGFFSRLLRRPP
jgi:molecular chaperone DnaK